MTPLSLKFTSDAACSQELYDSDIEESETLEEGASITSAVAAKHFSFPPELKDSHFTKDDILRIGDKLVGYRHVSTEEHAQRDATYGLKSSCSLNISFCESETRPEIAQFTYLNKKIEREENCGDLIKKYEDAITHFISNSIEMDIWRDVEGDDATVRNVINTITKTRFMLIATTWYCSADTSFSCYGGLGRFSKESTCSREVTLLNRIKREDLEISDSLLDVPIKSEEEAKPLLDYLASHYRKELLTYLRRTGLDPEIYRSYFYGFSHATI